MSWLQTYENALQENLAKTFIVDGYCNNPGSAKNVLKLLMTYNGQCNAKLYRTIVGFCVSHAKAKEMLARYWPTFLARAERKDFDRIRPYKR